MLVCSETYEYYSLPYCQPKEGIKHKILGMGEVVDANRMASTPYALNFRTERKAEEVCTVQLDEEKLDKFRRVRHSLAWSQRQWLASVERASLEHGWAVDLCPFASCVCPPLAQCPGLASHMAG